MKAGRNPLPKKAAETRRVQGKGDGARSAAVYYSLIETAKANGCKPHEYLTYLFENLPFAKTEEDYRKLLPKYHSR